MSNLPILEVTPSSNDETKDTQVALPVEVPPKYDLKLSEVQAEQPDKALSIESLMPEEQAHIKAFMEKINLQDSQVIMTFGASAQNKSAQFADNVLGAVRTHDTGEVGKNLANLVVEIKNFEPETGEKPTGFIAKLLGGTKSIKNSIERSKANYAKVEVNINKIVSSLEGQQRTMLKDIAMLDTMYKTNLDYFKELTHYIIAGNEKLKQFNDVDIPAQRAKAEQTGDEMEVQKLNDMLSLSNRFEKKLHDLKLSRIISIQMAPQIRMIQNNNTVLIEKIQSSIVNAIPLWKNQMVLSLGMANSRAALDAQQKVTDMTNDMLTKNSELLKQGSVDIAKASEEGIVSIETLRKSSDNLITTINEVMDIQEKGSQARAAAEIELTKMEGDLKQALLEASVRKSGGMVTG